MSDKVELMFLFFVLFAVEGIVYCIQPERFMQFWSFIGEAYYVSLVDLIKFIF